MMRKTRVDREWLEHELLAPEATKASDSEDGSKTKSPTSSEPHSSEIGIASSTPRLFRRLKHKTQVFLNPDGDHFVTRMTHTIQVNQVGRAIARASRSQRGSHRGDLPWPRCRPFPVRAYRGGRSAP